MVGMLSAMNYDDHFRDTSDHNRSRLDVDDELSDDQYHSNLGSDRQYSNNHDETPEIASEVIGTFLECMKS